MAAEPREDQPVPPASEQVHLPDPSYLPVVVALGLTVMIVGVVINWVIVGIGAVVFLAATIRWIRDTREDISQLPLEH